MTVGLFLAYAAASFAFSLAPGPGVFLCSSQSLANGARAGVLAALGTQTGNAAYWTAFLLGLGALIAASEEIFIVVKYAGAAYLVVLGVLTIRNARRAAEAAAQAAPTPVWRTPYLQGLANQIANPKAMLFMVVLVPQFVTPGLTTAADFALLAMACIVIDFAVLCGYIWVAARTGALLRDPAQIVWRERAAGAAQIAVGGMIALMRRAA
jgi:homoserine/homoserine lactone efflux protein